MAFEIIMGDHYARAILNENLGSIKTWMNGHCHYIENQLNFIFKWIHKYFDFEFRLNFNEY